MKSGGGYGVTPDLNAFRWLYYVSGIRDWRFITEAMYVEHILPKTVDQRKALTFDDKNYYDIYFPDVNMPKTVIRNMNGKYLDSNYNLLSLNEALEIVKGYGDEKVVIKPSTNSCKGDGVQLISATKIDEVLNQYKSNFIVQECVRQHESFAKLCSTSSNVVRITSVLTDKVSTFRPTIRVGDEGRFTDQGGAREFCIGIDDEGCLCSEGVITKSDIRHEQCTPNGYTFGGAQIVGYREMVNTCKLLHPRLPYFPIIGWDFITDENGEVYLLECNLFWAGITKYQECSGPLFGEMTEEVLHSLGICK